MSIFSILMIISILLFVTSILLGYPICYGIFGPIVLKKSKKRNLSENYQYFGNILQMENELLDLASEENKEAIRVLKTIKICKFSAVVSLLLFIVFACIEGTSQPY